MKLIITLLLFTSTIFVYSQEEKTAITYSENVASKITSFKYSVNSVKEFEELDWQVIKSMFDINKPNEKIALSLELDLKGSKDKFKGSITVSGESKDIDSLIVKAKKKIKSLIKISQSH